MYRIILCAVTALPVAGVVQLCISVIRIRRKNGCQTSSLDSVRITDNGVRRGGGQEHMRASPASNARRCAGAVVVFSLLGVGCSEAPPAHCQDEVMAAFKRLEASGLPYRRETVRVYNGQAEFRATYEFLPPDRRRWVNRPSDPHYESEAAVGAEPTLSPLSMGALPHLLRSHVPPRGHACSNPFSLHWVSRYSPEAL